MVFCFSTVDHRINLFSTAVKVLKSYANFKDCRLCILHHWQYFLYIIFPALSNVPQYSVLGPFESTLEFSTMIWDVLKISRLFQNISVCSRLFPNILECSRLFPIIPEFSRMLLVIPKFSRREPEFSRMFKIVLEWSR